MKRLFWGLIVTVLASLGQVGFVGAEADTSNFTLANFQADYYLDRDSDGHSTLKTVESITAEFPEYDQNHGIERSIYRVFDGHSTSLSLQSVTDELGNELDYSIEGSFNDNLNLRIGEKDTYVHGLKTYVITYTQKDVTKSFESSNVEEFYWDVNGDNWSQPAKNVSAVLHLGGGLEDYLNGKQSCAFGAGDSKTSCVIDKSGKDIYASSVDMAANNTMTISVGFKTGTFKEYVFTAGDFIKRYAAIISSFLSLSLVIAIIVIKVVKGKDAPGRGTIIPEYLPPKDIDLITASIIGKYVSSWLPAAYIDLTVNHKIKIIELEKKTWGKKNYRLELISTEGLSLNQQAVVSALFGDNPSLGSSYEIGANKTDYRLFKKYSKLYKAAGESVKVGGYYRSLGKLKLSMYLLAVLVFMQAIIAQLFSSAGLTLYFGLQIMLSIILTSVCVMIISNTRPLSEKGKAISDYLKGLELYIKVAEEDRIKILQSPGGAEKTPVDTNDKEYMIKLYERVLPYAVLFGNEKEWTEVMGRYYDNQNMQPDWYFGVGAFSSSDFSSSFSSFSSDAGSSYNASSSGSSGASAGGGGGGGGGGGW